MTKKSKELTFQQKMVDVISRLKAPKGQYNKFGGYYYRNCEDIIEAAKPLLTEHGLVMTIADDIVVLGERFYVKAVVNISDGDKKLMSQGFAREPDLQAGMAAPQITGSASSYARKYALNGMFCIDDTKIEHVPDLDSNESKELEAKSGHQEGVVESSSESLGDYVRVSGKFHKGIKLDDIGLPTLKKYVDWASGVDDLKPGPLQDLHAIKKYLGSVGE